MYILSILNKLNKKVNKFVKQFSIFSLTMSRALIGPVWFTEYMIGSFYLCHVWLAHMTNVAL